MATVNATTGQQEHEINRGFGGYVWNDIDIATASLSSGDTIQGLISGNGMLFTRVMMQILTKSAATFTVDIGDGVDPNGWDDSVSLAAATNTITRSLEATDAYGVGRFYSASDTIDVIIDNTPGGEKIRLIGEYVRVAT